MSEPRVQIVLTLCISCIIEALNDTEAILEKSWRTPSPVLAETAQNSALIV